MGERGEGEKHQVGRQTGKGVVLLTKLRELIQEWLVKGEKLKTSWRRKEWKRPDHKRGFE